MKRYLARALSLSLLICFVLLIVTGESDVAKAPSVTGPSVIMSFDDIGGSNGPAMTGYILPQMNSYGYKGVGFVVASFDLTVARTLAVAGWEIGSHTMTHPHLSSGLSSSELTYQIVTSKTTLESSVAGATPVISFAYPFGEGNENATVLSLVQATYWLARDAGGYSSGVTWDGAARFDIMPYTIDDNCVIGEYIYRDIDIIGRVSVGDVRLTAVGSYAAGSTVASGNSDISERLYTFASLEKHRENMVTNGAYDVGEYIYREVDSSMGVSVGDVRLTTVGSYYAGSTVATGNSDIGSSLVAFTSLEKHAENMVTNSAYDVSNVDRALFTAKSTGKNVVLLSHGGDITSANFGIVLSKISAAISRGDISGVATFKDARVRTPGDVNADGIVDISDAAAVSAHWYPGPPIGPLGYNPNSDINGDGSVDILDSATVSAYWTGPPKGPSAP